MAQLLKRPRTEDFAFGWTRYWRTFGYSWSVVAGFVFAIVVSRLLADVVVMACRALWSARWWGGL